MVPPSGTLIEDSSHRPPRIAGYRESDLAPPTDEGSLNAMTLALNAMTLARLRHPSDAGPRDEPTAPRLPYSILRTHLGRSQKQASGDPNPEHCVHDPADQETLDP